MRPAAAFLVKIVALAGMEGKTGNDIDLINYVFDVIGVERIVKFGKMFRRVVFAQKFTGGMAARRLDYARTTPGDRQAAAATRKL